MTNSQVLIAQLEDLTSFLILLRNTDSSVWTAPIAEGKWSVPDIIAHIMAWDRNFMGKIMPKLVRRELVTLEEDMDFQGFNNRAVEYGRTLNQKQLLDEAIFYRTKIVSQLKKLPEDAFITDVPVTSFTLSSFLQNMFVSHDNHHRKQIEEYLGHFVEIRLLTKDDAIEYWNIRLRALREEPSAFSAAYEEEAHKPIEDIVNRFREQWSLQENYILGAFKDGMLIGMVGFVREHRKKVDTQREYLGNVRGSGGSRRRHWEIIINPIGKAMS